jgi:hypothetical protein
VWQDCGQYAKPARLQVRQKPPAQQARPLQAQCRGILYSRQDLVSSKGLYFKMNFFVQLKSALSLSELFVFKILDWLVVVSPTGGLLWIPSQFPASINDRRMHTSNLHLRVKSLCQKKRAHFCLFYHIFPLFGIFWGCRYFSMYLYPVLGGT